LAEQMGFSLVRQIASYLGLVPLEPGGQRRRLGHITEQGNSLLCFLLVEAAQVTVRRIGNGAESTSTGNAARTEDSQSCHGAGLAVRPCGM
jgi:transposase